MTVLASWMDPMKVGKVLMYGGGEGRGVNEYLIKGTGETG